MARETYEMEELIAVDGPTPKRRKLTDYFAKLPSNTEAQEFPQCLMSALMQDDKRFDHVERTAPRFTGLYAIGRGCILSNVALISLRSSETLTPRMPEP